MPKLSQRHKQFAVLALFLYAAVCAAQKPTANAVQRPASPAPGWRVTRAALAASVVPAGRPCPLAVTFNGEISTNGPADVRYTWVSSDGGAWPEHSLHFARAGTEKIAEQRDFFENTTGWMQVKILTPNDLQSNQASYKVNCTGPGGGPGKVTGASLTVAVAVSKPSQVSACPVTLNFNGSITTSGSAEVKYTWISSDNARWPEHTLNFAKAGTERVSETWQVGMPGPLWVQLKVLTPNAVVSPRAHYTVACPKTK
jgi:hypothetical protein